MEVGGQRGGLPEKQQKGLPLVDQPLLPRGPLSQHQRLMPRLWKTETGMRFRVGLPHLLPPELTLPLPR